MFLHRKVHFSRLRKASIFAGLLFALALSSCKSTQGTLEISGIGYQAINTKKPQLTKNEKIPSDAEILVTYAIDQDGKIAVMVKNLTNQIMIVDQEMSFFINTTGESLSYYDPSVYTKTESNFNANTSGASFNLGALANAFGVGGALGSLLGGTTVGGSSTYGQTLTNTVTVSDQKRINIGPKGMVAMSKNYKINGIGQKSISSESLLTTYTYDNSPAHFSVCIYYSSDEGKTFQKIVTDFYASTYSYSPITNKDNVNGDLRKFMISKPDLFSQPWYILYFNNNITETTGDDFFVPMMSTAGKVFDNIVQGILFDYQ